jgi:membrane protein DedA with SNARE-associated domain
VDALLTQLLRPTPPLPAYPPTPTFGTIGLGNSWWIFLVVFLAVTASWAGVPAIGGLAAGTAGALASQGQLGLAAVITVVVLAGELGGLIGYSIGLRWGRSLVERPGKRQESRERALASAEHLYARWGRLAVFVTPAIFSGTAAMRRREFVVWNFVAALGFACFTVGGAYGIGRLVTGHHAEKDLAVLVLGVSLGAGLYLGGRRLYRRREAHLQGDTIEQP